MSHRIRLFLRKIHDGLVPKIGVLHLLREMLGRVPHRHSEICRAGVEIFLEGRGCLRAERHVISGASALGRPRRIRIRFWTLTSIVASPMRRDSMLVCRRPVRRPSMISARSRHHAGEEKRSRRQEISESVRGRQPRMGIQKFQESRFFVHNGRTGRKPCPGPGHPLPRPARQAPFPDKRTLRGVLLVPSLSRAQRGEG